MIDVAWVAHLLPLMAAGFAVGVLVGLTGVGGGALMTPLLISSFAFNFNNVVIILLLTRGAPDIQGTLIPAGQTDILGSFTFRMSFQDAGQSFGIAGAISTLIFLLVGILAYANFFALRRAAEARGRG